MQSFINTTCAAILASVGAFTAGTMLGDQRYVAAAGMLGVVGWFSWLAFSYKEGR